MNLLQRLWHALDTPRMPFIAPVVLHNHKENIACGRRCPRLPLDPYLAATLQRLGIADWLILPHLELDPFRGAFSHWDSYKAGETQPDNWNDGRTFSTTTEDEHASGRRSYAVCNASYLIEVERLWGNAEVVASTLCRLHLWPDYDPIRVSQMLEEVLEIEQAMVPGSENWFYYHYPHLMSNRT